MARGCGGLVMSVTDEKRAFLKDLYRHHPQSPAASTWTFDEAPRSQPTPDEITQRAEEYIRTRATACYANLDFDQLREFWLEVIRVKRAQRLGAWRHP
jgi:hypothetical protein